MTALCFPRVFLAATAGRPATASGATPKWHPGHYVFVGQAPINPALLSAQLRGVQRLYAWSDLEPSEGQYDFSPIRADLAQLAKLGKQLVLQIQYKAFGHGQRRVPSYVQGFPYGGGVYRASSGAWNPVLWNPRVGERVDLLLAALGKAFDGEPGVEAAVLPETAPGAALRMNPQPGVDAYSLPVYVEALKSRMMALRQSFPRTVVIQYANYPVSALDDLAAMMRAHGVGLGGPDVYPRPSDLADPRTGVYRLYSALSGVVPLGAAVQGPNYSVAAKKRSAAFDRGAHRTSAVTTPEEEAPIPVRDHLRLAQETLKLNYLFWSAYPRADFERVKQMLAEPDLSIDAAGGLVSTLPSRAFLV